MSAHFIRLLVIVSAIYALLALIFLVIRTLGWGKETVYAVPSGKAGRGIWYAFGQGMLPWEKESAGKHLPTFIAGMFYHAAIFAAISYLGIILFGVTAGNLILNFLRLLLVAGSAAGIGLFVKRIYKPQMRAISTPDDYVANLLVTLFTASALLAVWQSHFVTLFMVTAAVLFLYIPTGKIRHCFFFFYGRIIFGAFNGRRNIFPHQARES